MDMELPNFVQAISPKFYIKPERREPYSDALAVMRLRRDYAAFQVEATDVVQATLESVFHRSQIRTEANVELAVPPLDFEEEPILEQAWVYSGVL